MWLRLGVIMIMIALHWRRTQACFVGRTYHSWTRSRSITRNIAFSNLSATQYTITEPGVDPDVLQKTVEKHFNNLHRYTSEKPIAAHTQEAFTTLKEELVENDAPVILDSGCGTGRSTLLLGRMFPEHVVIGVDRSLARLSKNGVYRQQSSSSDKGNRDNVIFVRAELADFWRLWLETPLGSLEKHFLLYPNPYPKKKRFQNRWYAHPAFPLIRKLGGNEILVRSNWKAYLDDFSTALSILEDLEGDSPSYQASGPSVLDPEQDAWTAFEKKYFDVGETSYELVISKI